MKTKKLNKKLEWSKVTIANLQHHEMERVQGGLDTEFDCSIDPLNCRISSPWLCPTDPGYPTCGG